MINSCLPHWIVKIVWLQCLTLQVCPWVVFLSNKTFTKQILAKLVEKTKKLVCITCLGRMYVDNNFWSLDVNGCPQHLCTCCQFQLCILVVQTHYNLGLFEATKTSGQTMALKLQALLNKFGLKRKKCMHVKNENLQSFSK